MRLRDARDAILFEYLPRARRISPIHQIDSSQSAALLESVFGSSSVSRVLQQSVQSKIDVNAGGIKENNSVGAIAQNER
jgi:hypothetical protein